MNNALYYIGLFLLGYFMFVWIGYNLSLLLTIPIILRKFNETKYNDLMAALEAKPFLPITILTPAFNEMHRIDNTIASILNSNYKNVHIIIVNDGSTDDTLGYLTKKYALEKITPAFMQILTTGKVKQYYQSTTIPNFIVIDKEHSPYANSGADCMNAGINACRTPLFLALDADTILEPESISRMLFMYLTHPHCIAIGANIYVPDKTKIKNGVLLETAIPKNLTLGIQVTEYLRSFIYGHEGWTPLGGALCHAGACTLFEKKAVLDVGGYDAYNFSYDAEMIMKLHHWMLKNRFPYNIVYASNAIAWADQPFTLKQLWKQRNYWQRGLLRCLLMHKQMLFNPHYKKVGLLGFPAYLVYEIIGPVIEGFAYLTGVVAIIVKQVMFLRLLWLLFLCFGFLLLITAACMLISTITYDKYYRKRDIIKLVYLTILDLLFYRPFRGICCFVASIEFIKNRLLGKAL